MECLTSPSPFSSAAMIAVQFLPSSHDNKALKLFSVCHLHSKENHEAEDCQSDAKALLDGRFC